MKRNTDILGYRVVERSPNTFYPQCKKHSWFGWGKPKWYYYTNGYTECREYFGTKNRALEFIENVRTYNEHKVKIVYEDKILSRKQKLEALGD